MSRFSDIHIEQDFWNDFIVEAFEHIDSIEANVMSLEQNPEDMELIHTMFRAFHTIKGLAGFVEHTLIQEVAHKTETLMDYCRKGDLKVSTDIVNAILKTSDYIKQLCNDINSFQDESLVETIEAHLETLERLSQVAENSELVETNQTTEPELVVEVETEHQPTQEEMAKALEDFANEISEVEKTEEPEKEMKQEEQEETTFEFNEPQPVETVEEQPQQNEEISENVEAKEFNFDLEEKSTEPAFNMEPASIQEPVIEQKEEEKDPNLEIFQQNIVEKLKGDNTPKKVEAAKESPAMKQMSASEDYMKVANYKIDHLVDMISELIINQSLIEQYVFTKYNDDRQLVSNMSGFLRITRELQNLSMSLRMVALKPTFQKIARIARDTIQELKKDVEFVMNGENTEIDRVVAEKLLDPLVHMIKNSISHGIEENPQDRINKGKSQKGRVEICAYNKRGKIFIEVKDDGRGINTEIVYQKALEKGLVDPNKTYSDAEIKEFIMLPGFSTAKVVDNISGRGVGMDVVKTQILKIGGKVDIQSELNEGSTFTLEVPVNHAIMNGTIIELNDQQFVVPTINVKEFLQPKENQWIFTKSKRTMIKVRDNIIPIVPSAAFSMNSTLIEEEKDIPLVMVLELDQELRALPIKNVINRQEVVVKPVSEEFSHLKYISGMSILGTGKVSLILDIDYLFRKEIKE